MAAEVKDAPRTPDLKLTGEKSKKQIGLDGKTVIAEKPDPLVVERAREYARHLDTVDVAKDKAEKAYAELVGAFKKSKRQRKVTVTTEWNVWTFKATETYKVEKKKDNPIK